MPFSYVKTTLMVKNRMGFWVFSGSQGHQRKKFNLRKSKEHHQTAKEDKGSPGSLWAPQVGLGKIIQVQTTWLWWELPPVKDLATFLKVEKALGGWGHHLWEQILLTVKMCISCISAKAKMKTVYSGKSSCTPHLYFLSEPSTLCFKNHILQYLKQSFHCCLPLTFSIPHSIGGRNFW